MRAWFHFIGLVIGCVPLIVVPFAVGWWWQGGRLLAVQTASMAPSFHPGDAVLVRHLPLRNLHPGDIISYRSSTEPGTVVSHRLLRRVPGGGFVVQGDRLRQPDPQVAPGQIIGRATAVLPHFGMVMQWLHTPPGLALTVYLPAFLGLVYECRRFLQPRPVLYRLR